MECWERLPEPMVMTPDDDSKVCHVWDLEAFVLTCGREEIEVGARVILYPYDSVTKAKAQYDKLGWWTSKALFFCRTDHYIVPRCCDIYALVEWTSSDWHGTERRKCYRLRDLGQFWLDRLLRRELDYRRQGKAHQLHSDARADEWGQDENIELRDFVEKERVLAVAHEHRKDQLRMRFY